MIIIGQFIESRNIAEVITRALNTRHYNSLQIIRPKVYLYRYDLENKIYYPSIS